MGLILTPKMKRAGQHLLTQLQEAPASAAPWLAWLIALARLDRAPLPASSDPLRLYCQRLLDAGLVERRAGGVRLSAMGEAALMNMDRWGSLDKMRAKGWLDAADCLPPWLQAPPPRPDKPSNNAA